MAANSDKSGAGEARWRCFWAALLEPPSEARLEALVEPLRTAGGLRWIPRANWHLTVHFLGATGAKQIGALSGALRERTFPMPLSLNLLDVAPFPTPRPRLLAARFFCTPALEDWVAYLRACSVAVGLPAEERAFQAHVTVARCVRGRRGPLPELPAKAELNFDRLVLMRSIPGAGGPRYLPLAEKTAGA